MADQISEVSKSCQNLVLQREDIWLMGSPLCYWAEFSSVDISCTSSTKQSESTPNSKIWEPLALADQIGFVDLPKHRFAKRGPHRSCGPLFAIRTNFQVWISPAHRVPSDRNDRQTVRLGRLWPCFSPLCDWANPQKPWVNPFTFG